MEVGLKDLITWGGMAVGLVGQFFHLKGRVSILETKLDIQSTHHNEALAIQSKHHDDALDRIDRKLERIERKMDEKADK